MDTHKTLPINEIYTAIQGEGQFAGYPTVVIRTIGCTHRCYFGDGGWCDSWHNSIYPDCGKYNFNDIEEIYKYNPQCKDMMITGGSPTLHRSLLNDLVVFAHNNNIRVTLETEGSHFVKTDYPIDLVSISPKFSNTIPQLGTLDPIGNVVEQSMIDQHNKFRLNKEVIRQMIDYHADYQYKPVWNGTDDNINEIEAFRYEMNIPCNKTWLMPAGDCRKTLLRMYAPTIEMALKMGYNFTGRPHIIAYDRKRFV